MVFGNGAFAWWLGLDEAMKWGWGPYDGISGLIRRDQWACSFSLSHVSIQGEGGRLQTRKRSSPEPNPAGTLILDFPASNCEKSIYFVQATQSMLCCYSSQSWLRYTLYISVLFLVGITLEWQFLLAEQNLTAALQTARRCVCSCKLYAPPPSISRNTFLLATLEEILNYPPIPSLENITKNYCHFRDDQSF